MTHTVTAINPANNAVGIQAGEMNTAQLRTAAGAAEDRREWSTAAWLYDSAADNYPASLSGKVGALQLADVNALRKRAQSCRVMVRS
jgi:hypothetical protein